MRPQISKGFGSEWTLIKANESPVATVGLHGKEGVAVILFPETDTPSYFAVKRLCEKLLPDEPIKQELADIIKRIEAINQDIYASGKWEDK